MQSFSYNIRCVCVTNVSFDIDNGNLYNIKFDSGCMGSLQAITKLAEGRDAKQVADALQNIVCRDKGTSCADQLSKAINMALLEVKDIT